MGAGWRRREVVVGGGAEERGGEIRRPASAVEQRQLELSTKVRTLILPATVASLSGLIANVTRSSPEAMRWTVMSCPPPHLRLPPSCEDLEGHDRRFASVGHGGLLLTGKGARASENQSHAATPLYRL